MRFATLAVQGSTAFNVRHSLIYVTPRGPAYVCQCTIHPNSLMISAFIKSCVKTVAPTSSRCGCIFINLGIWLQQNPNLPRQFPGPGIVINQVKGLYQEYEADQRPPPLL